MSPGATERLPLFPLGSVLFPGLLLPLHIFEDRYRRLVRDLVARPENAPHRFGVVAIRRGAEAGDLSPDLYDIGCTAELRQVEPLADGRFNIVAVGGTRFRLYDVDGSRPYLVGAVELLPDEVGDRLAAAGLARRLRSVFSGYLSALQDLQAMQDGEGPTPPSLPEDPVQLSYLVAATALLDLGAKQRLLAEPDAVARLQAALTLVARERAIVERLHAVPAPELLRFPRSGS